MFSSDIHTKEFIKNLKVFLNKVYNFLKKYWYFAVLCLIFTVGVALRLEAYFSGKQFHLDEGMLALSFLRNDGVLWVFRPLLSMQMAPPLFLICVKILANIFGYSELVLRFIPFLSSIIAIPAFYRI